MDIDIELQEFEFVPMVILGIALVEYAGAWLINHFLLGGIEL